VRTQSFGVTYFGRCTYHQYAKQILQQDSRFIADAYFVFDPGQLKVFF